MPTKNAAIDSISIEVAKELGLSPDLVKTVNRMQWRFLLETIQSESNDPVQLIYLGKFVRNKKFKDGSKIKRDFHRFQKPDIS